MKKYSWNISNENSSIQFKVKYYKISNIIGSFLRFSGMIVADESFKDPEISVAIEANSIQTWDKNLNAIIRSDSYLDAEKFPDIIFTSSQGCQPSAGGIQELTGDLNIRGIIHPVTMIINFSEIKKDLNAPIAIFHLFGKISLKDFQLGRQTDERVNDQILIYTEMNLYRS